jgi:uncharacterized protein (DUF1697 family)
MATKQTHIALLRGINVGSHNRIPMPRLRDLLGELGYEDVRTLVQSGNIVLTSSKSPERLASDLQREIADAFDVDTPVVVRTRDELARVIERDPLSHIADELKRYQVTFMDRALTQEVLDKLGSLDVAPEQFVVDGREIYAWHPDGMQRSKLGQALAGQRLRVVATARNWNTVTKLLELADE